MKRIYSLFKQYASYVLLISVCLQSCGGGFNNPLIPTGEEQIASIQTDAQTILLPTNIQPLVGRTLIAQKGHAVTFYEQAGELKANVVMNVAQGFSKSYKGISVTVEHAAELTSLSQLDIKAQERRIEFQLAKGKHPARVIIYKGSGLMGGGNMLTRPLGKRNEKPKEQEQASSTLPTIMPELWQYIFSYLDFEGVLAARSVSADWNRLITGFREAGIVGVENKPCHISDTRSWVKRKVIDFRIKGGLASATIPSFAFYHLMGHISCLSHAFWPYLEGTNVHTLDLSYNELGAQGARELAKALTGTQVHTLHLGSNKLGAQGARELAKALTGTQVHTLDLSYNELGAQGARELAKALTETQVHTLHLGSNKLGDQGARELAKALTETQVHTLNLRSNQIGDVGARELAKALTETQVHTLDLRNNQIGPAGARELAKALPETQVHTLNLESNRISGVGARELAKALPATTRVHTLHLSYNLIGDAGAELAKALQGTQVHTLHLEGNGINAQGAIELAKALQGTQVHTLNLSRNYIGVGGARELTKALQGTQVHTLHLGSNKIGDQGAIELGVALVATRVHTLDLSNNYIGAATEQLLKEQYPHIKWEF
jgi:Ran GTPase-activating protein (RanGAP) involved in mRNA processing and transport